MDDETRYWIAKEVADSKFKHDARKVFNEAKTIADKRPETLITDGSPAYHDAFNKEFYTNVAPTISTHKRYKTNRSWQYR